MAGKNLEPNVRNITLKPLEMIQIEVPVKQVYNSNIDHLFYVCRNPFTGNLESVKTQPTPYSYIFMGKVARQMIMYCVKCNTKHVDKGIWEYKLHKTHLCEYCGHQWTPDMIQPTVGVEYTKGYFLGDVTKPNIYKIKIDNLQFSPTRYKEMLDRSLGRC